MSEVLALIAHDLKNALGGLEAELARLSEAPTTDSARAAHLQCQDLRQQFVQFLTLYGAEQGQLRALCEDESPSDVLASLQTRWLGRLLASGSPLTIQVAMPIEGTPAFAHFDRRLVYMALDAAVHNASRFARTTITLSVQPEARQGHVGLRYQVDDDGPGLGQHDDLATATGLGTSLCHAVAMAHRLGALHGHSELITLFEEGQATGCRYSLWLP
jgi:signal transduction histidine kinase